MVVRLTMVTFRNIVPVVTWMCCAFLMTGKGHLVFFPSKYEVAEEMHRQALRLKETVISPETENEAPMIFMKVCCDTRIDRSLAHSFTSSARIRAYEGALLGVLGVLGVLFLALQQLVSE